jgi:LemA protein
MNAAYAVLVIPGVILLVLIAWVAGTYNRLVGLRNTVKESWADVTTELKRRYDLIPNLVNTVKGYVQHEREIMDAVTKAHELALSSAPTPAAQAQAENGLTQALRSLFALAENYPQLRAAENFTALQQELANTEDRIQAARRFYNGNVRDNNNAVQFFPGNIIAGMFGFRTADFFEIDDPAVAEPVKVSFG